MGFASKKNTKSKWIKTILNSITKKYFNYNKDNPKRIMPLSKWTKLIISIATDAIGILTYFIPLRGEFLDFIWAPASALIIFHLYKNVKWTIFGGIEEILPFMDIIPTATLNWYYNYYKK